MLASAFLLAILTCGRIDYLPGASALVRDIPAGSRARARKNVVARDSGEHAVNCPYCDFKFDMFVANANIKTIPDLTPMLCERCAEVSLFDAGAPRKMTAAELAAIQQSPSWGFIATAKVVIARVRAMRHARDN